jgi:hypothetical protein
MIEGGWHTMVAYLGGGMRWLKNAQCNLAAVISSDSYISAKVAASIVLGLILGVIITEIGISSDQTENHSRSISHGSW